MANCTKAFSNSMTLSIQMAHAMETTISHKEWFVSYASREYTMADGKNIRG